MRRTVFLAALILSSAFGARAQAPNTISTVAGGGTNTSGAPKPVSLPLFFEANQGQADSRVKFLTRSSGYTLFLTPTETMLAEASTRVARSKKGFGMLPELKSAPSGVLRMQLIGANRAPSMMGFEELTGKVNYLIGNDPAKWRTGVPLFSRVQARQVYPGVDLVFHGDDKVLEYDFVVAPGADPGQVAFRIRGAKRIEIDPQGDLVMHTAASEFRMHKPVIYQLDGASRREIEGGFVLSAKNQVRFQLGDYDRNQPLVIDPTIGYATFLGGQSLDQPSAIAVDSSDPAAPRLYVTGFTGDTTSFPEVSNPLIGSAGAVAYGFIAKINPTAIGSGSLNYLTFIGGHTPYPGDAANGCLNVLSYVALDFSQGATGIVPVVSGLTQCSDYPKTTTIGTVTGTTTGVVASVVTRLNAAGTNFDASAVLGGNGTQENTFLSVDSAGNAMVSGGTSSTNLPLSALHYMTFNNGNSGTNAGYDDCFVADLRRSDFTPTYLTYLNIGAASTSSDTIGCGAIKDSAGKVNAGGNTFSPTAFNVGPGGTSLANGFQTSFHGVQDTVGMRLDPTLSGTAELLYATYYGGGGITNATNGALDLGNGVVAMGGFTTSNSSTNAPDIPLAHELQNSNLAAGVGGETGFLVLINTAATGQASLLCSTYFGGSSGSDEVHAVNYDAGDPNSFRILLGGQTRSGAGMNFPLLNTLQSFQGVQDGYVSVLKVPQPGQSFNVSLFYSTYIGSGVQSSGGSERIVGVAVDGNHTVYATGRTLSSNFFANTNPATAVNGFQATCTNCATTLQDDAVVFSLKTGASAILQSITVSPATATISAAQTQQFKALGLYSDGTEQDITVTASWSSSNTNVATIQTAPATTPGLATGVSGSANPVTITALSGGHNGQALLTVTPSGSDLAITKTASPTVAVNGTLTYTIKVTNNGPQDATGVVMTDPVPGNLSPTNVVASETCTRIVNIDTGATTLSCAIGALANGVSTTITYNVSPIVAGTLTNTASVAGTQTDPNPSNNSATVNTTVGLTLVSIAVTPANPSIAKGRTQQFVATGTFSDNSTQNLTSQVTWASATPAVATITAGGLATGASTGTSSISATLTGISGSTVLTVTAAVLQSIAVTPANPSIAKGRTQQFTATGTFSDNSTQNLTSQVTWASATPAVATVTAGGLATGVGTGTSNISATLTGITGSTVLTVTAAVLQSIAVTPANPSIAKGRTQQFTATGTFSDNSTQNLTSQVTWASATPAVATITAGGLATGVGTGTSNISATLTGITGSTVLTVTAAVLQSIAVTPPNPTIATGLTQQFTATGTFSDNSTQNLTAQVTWASATPAVATINAAGLATGVTVGTSNISATLTGITGSTVLTVTTGIGPTLVSITIIPATPTIPLGQFMPLFAQGNFSDGSIQDLTATSTWASDTLGVATVSNAAGSQGQVTGVGPGTATISATSAGITGNTLVTVAPNPFMAPPQLFFTEPTLGTQTPSQLTTFTNPGPGSLNITGITLTGSFQGDFGQTSDCGTVPASGTCPIDATFKPTAPGPRTADVSVASTSVFSPTVAHLTGNGSIRQLPGFTTNALAANDDGSTGQVTLPFSINFFGTTFSSLFVNNNGNVTFGTFLGDFTPSGLNTNNGGIPIIAPFWADVDTTGMGSSLVTYGNDTVNGRTAFGVNYQNVGYFASNFDKLNSFQLVLIDRSDTGTGNFDIEFNYDKIQWEVGDASRNDGGTGGLCGTLSLTDCTPAAVGYSNGTGNPGTNFQLAGSFVAGALLDGGPAGTSLIANDLSNSTLGRYLFSVRNGVVQADTLTLTLAGAGTGTVKDNTGQLNCSDMAGGQRTCTANYPSGTQLVLTATADTGSTFTGWSAPCSGTGTCAFTITQNTNITATFAAGNVTLQSITVAPPTPSIVAGTTQTFTATGHFSDGSTGPVTVSWSSGNTAIATINAATGVATGVAAGGPITITATSTQTTTISGTAQLTVTAAPVLVSIAVTPANPTVVVGQNQQFTATGTLSDKSTQDLTNSVLWASSNTEAATITPGGGLATGLTGGETTNITATKVQGNTNIVGTTTLTVTTVPFILTITPPPGGNPGAPPTISPGGTLAIGLTLTAAPGFTGTVSFGCVSNQPQFLTCTPAPSSVTLSGNTPKQVAIVMNTFCQGETPMYGPGPGGFGGGLALLLAAAMLGSITWAYRTRSRWALSFAVLLLMALGSAACSSPSSGPNGRTPAGTYTLNITATAGGASQTVQQTIQVTP